MVSQNVLVFIIHIEDCTSDNKNERINLKLRSYNRKFFVRKSKHEMFTGYPRQYSDLILLLNENFVHSLNIKSQSQNWTIIGNRILFIDKIA